MLHCTNTLMDVSLWNCCIKIYKIFFDNVAFLVPSSSMFYVCMNVNVCTFVAPHGNTKLIHFDLCTPCCCTDKEP